jgi:hypothetical protein
MSAMQILRLVRNGYALATSDQVEVIICCPDLQVVEGKWVPRWALEAEVALEDCGLKAEQLRKIFGQGKDCVAGELKAMVRAGKRARLVEPRRPYERSRIDLLTEAALTGALWHHREICALCKSREPCGESEALRDELNLLFPPERRKAKRSEVQAM